jgi:hypothetical protein
MKFKIIFEKDGPDDRIPSKHIIAKKMWNTEL